MFFYDLTVFSGFDQRDVSRRIAVQAADFSDRRFL
jgi:hypothetical protein